MTAAQSTNPILRILSVLSQENRELRYTDAKLFLGLQTEIKTILKGNDLSKRLHIMCPMQNTKQRKVHVASQIQSW